MKIKLYRSSTIGISSGGVKILMDPWLTDGEYYGSWHHFPYFDIESYKDELNSYDCIYISHIHPDHCSEKTLNYIHKSIPIYIHSYHEKFLKLKLERLGFKVIELENNKRSCIKNNLHINIIASDNCDPELCYKFFGCKSLDNSQGSKQIDTISVIDDNKFSVVNVNDSPFELRKTSIENLKKKYDHFDLLLTGYTGAGPYPQCVDNFSLKEKIYFGEQKKINFYSNVIII